MATIIKNTSCLIQKPIKIQVPITSLSQKPTSSACFSQRQYIKQLVCTTVTKCLLENNGDPVGFSGTQYPKPSEIQWKKDICNSVQLIGIVGLPIQLTHLTSGKVVASTRLAVRKSQTDTTWINLTFWDDLAQIAHQHVEKGQQIYVSGRLVSDEVDGEDGKQRTYFKVVVQQLNFVERNPPPVTLYDGNNTSLESVGKSDNFGTTKSSIQELWQAFFANPVDWWDNRRNKKNPKYPDFKHKDTGEALWVESKYNPSWVKSQLEILDSRMESYKKHDNGGFSLF